MQRPHRDEYFLEIAQVVAKRSTCPRLAVGAVLVSPNFHIISTGYNGAPAHTEHCGCVVDDAGHCTRAVHAEANTIAQAAFGGRATEYSRLYITHYPCIRCVSLAANAGVKAVIYGCAYKDNPEVERIVNESFMIMYGVKS